MEVRLQKALEKKKADELRASTEMSVPRSRIATPGSRSTARSIMGGTPRMGTPRNGNASTPRNREPTTPRSVRGPRGL